MFLNDGQAIFDLFGRGFTLLRFDDIDVDALVATAAECGMPLKIVDIRDDRARALYQRDLVLIRPDHHIAWRGDTGPGRPDTVIDRVRGAAPAGQSTTHKTAKRGSHNGCGERPPHRDRISSKPRTDPR